MLSGCVPKLNLALDAPPLAFGSVAQSRDMLNVTLFLYVYSI